jgi:hypothetical protein
MSAEGEGYSESSIVGWKLSRQLKTLIASARVAERK